MPYTKFYYDIVFRPVFFLNALASIEMPTQQKGLSEISKVDIMPFESNNPEIALMHE